MILLLTSIPALLLASTLSLAFPRENPSANRMVVVAPVIFTLAALPLGLLIESTKSTRSHESIDTQLRGLRVTRRSNLLAGAIITGVLIVAARQNYVAYFDAFAAQYRATVPNVREIAESIKQQRVPLEQTYILAYPYWLDGRNLALALGDLDWQADHDLTSDQPLPRDSARPLLFVLRPEDDSRRRELEAAFPGGQYRVKISATPGKDWAFYLVPAR